jgi:hypothetical protein
MLLRPRRSTQPLGGMKRILQALVGIFALIGVWHVALIIYGYFGLPACIGVAWTEAVSPDGRYVAVYKNVRCDDSSRSSATVGIGLAGEKRSQTIMMNVKGTTDVRLTWNGNRELFVHVPQAAVVEKFGPYEDLPRVSVRRDEDREDAT